MTSTISTTTEKAAAEASSSLWKDRLERILAQDRRALNFEHYTVSKEHSKRMEQLAQQVPQLYGNPEITPRSKWFHHPRFNENSQMPPYHVHFREEMKHVLSYVYKAYNGDDTRKQMKSACRMFSGSMRGLNGHVSIEEYSVFPVYRDCFPEVNIDFLYHDHKSLKEAEHKIVNELEALAQKESVSKDEIVDCLQQVLDFDDQLMAHMGEEEEIVVPMSLTDQEIWF
jgi:hemerythrin-like domain-containing protein